METLKMKIVSWDEESLSLILRFASDETANTNPDAYFDLAFQPHTMFPEATTADEIKTHLARSGISIAESIKADEDLRNNASKLAMLAGLVDANTTLSYSVSDLQDESDEIVAPLVEV